MKTKRINTKKQELQRGAVNWGMIGLLLFVGAVGATIFGFYQIDPSHIMLDGRSGEDLSFLEVVFGAIVGVIGLIIGLIVGLIGLIIGLVAGAIGLFIGLGVVMGPVLLLVFTIWIFTRGGKRDKVTSEAPSEASVE